VWHRPPSKEGILLLSDEHLSFVNRLQQVPYRLNPFILELMDLLNEKEIELGKFCPISYKEPASVAQRLGYGSVNDYDEQTNLVLNHPDFLDAKRQRGKEIGEQKYVISSGNAANTRGLQRAINTVRDHERFYLPTYWDFRGRVYYTVPFLNPQGYDPGKGILQFADPTPVDDRTSYYLKLSISTALGYDKLSYEERIDKVEALEEDITNVALMLGEGDFSKAMGFLGKMKDDVFEGAAACEEYYWCCLAPVNQRRTHTHYRCALDATAQGAQLVSGFRRSQAGAAKVNLLPCPRPNDVYLNLWNELIDVVMHDGSVRPKILKALKETGYGRKLAKSGILMSAQYGSGINKQIAEFKKIHADIPAQYQLNESELALFIGEDDHRPFTIALERATSIAAYVNWMRKVTDKVMKTGRRNFAVRTVNGNVCLMRYPKRKKHQILTFHHSSINLSPLTKEFVHREKTPNPDPKDLAKATSANAIHAQDAALLSHAYHDWTDNISTVHDSILSAPGKAMDRLADRFVQSFVDTISWDFWESVYDANGLEHDSNVHDAVIGDLDIGQVRQANYLVC
jgi:DNA-directed RNA polymerase